MVQNSNVIMLVICRLKNVVKGLFLDFLLWRIAVVVCVAYPQRFPTIDLLLTSKILIFVVES